MAWHVVDPHGRTAGTGETEKLAWAAAERYTRHEPNQMMDAGYRCERVRQAGIGLFGWLRAAVGAR